MYTSLIRPLVFLSVLLFSFSSMAEIAIKHKPVKRANSGERITIVAQITDVSEPAKSVRLARVYFSADSGDIKHFVPLNQEEDQFSGLLPAPDVHTESVTYQILVVNSANEIQKSEELTISIKADEEAAARLATKDPTDIHIDVSSLKVFSEYAPGIDQASVSGFNNYTVNYVSPNQAYGVTGQVVEPGSSVSSSSAGASSPGTFSGTVATTGDRRGIGAGAIGGLALAGAAVAGSGGSSGGEDTSDDALIEDDADDALIEDCKGLATAGPDRRLDYGFDYGTYSIKDRMVVWHMKDTWLSDDGIWNWTCDDAFSWKTWKKGRNAGVDEITIDEITSCEEYEGYVSVTWKTSFMCPSNY